MRNGVVYLLSVTTNVDGGITTIPIASILYIKYIHRIKLIEVHTNSKIYYITGTIKYWLTVLNNSGYNFYLVDRGTLINTANVKEIDISFKEAYFVENAQRGSDKSCMLAQHRIDLIFRELYAANPTIQMKY